MISRDLLIQQNLLLYSLFILCALHQRWTSAHAHQFSFIMRFLASTVLHKHFYIKTSIKKPENIATNNIFI